jgi:ribonuclease-3
VSDSPEGFEAAERARLAELLGYEFGNPILLETAFTHPSFSHELDGSRGNERLEYLGDAVLDLVVAHFLYDAHPGWSEGDLTRARRTIVNNKNLASHARGLGLGEFVRLSRGERRAGGAARGRLLGNLFEAVVGAIYLDGGLDAATTFLRRTVGADLEVDGGIREHDPKTRLQEWTMAIHRSLPSYALVSDTGIENDGERFCIEVSVEGLPKGQGRGRTKRDAEQRAADAALHEMGVDA